MNTNLFTELLRMFRERAKYHRDLDCPETAAAYESASMMLKYAIEGNEECLRQFDYYHDIENEFGKVFDEDYEPDDIDNDCGYDPYMGCFSDDC